LYEFIVEFQKKDPLCAYALTASTSDQATFDQTADDRMYMDCLNTAEQCKNVIRPVAFAAGLFSTPVLNMQACYDYCSPMAAAAPTGIKTYNDCYKAGLDGATTIVPTIYS